VKCSNNPSLPLNFGRIFTNFTMIDFRYAVLRLIDEASFFRILIEDLSLANDLTPLWLINTYFYK